MGRGVGPWLASRSMDLLQIGAHQVDEVLAKLGRDLLFGPVLEVETDVVFEDLAHQSVDTAAHRGEQHELPAAVFIGRKGTLNGVELAAQFAQPLQ